MPTLSRCARNRAAGKGPPPRWVSHKNAKIGETRRRPPGPAPATTSWVSGAWSAMPIPYLG